MVFACILGRKPAPLTGTSPHPPAHSATVYVNLPVNQHLIEWTHTRDSHKVSFHLAFFQGPSTSCGTNKYFTYQTISHYVNTLFSIFIALGFVLVFVPIHSSLLINSLHPPSSYQLSQNHLLVTKKNKDNPLSLHLSALNHVSL